MSKLLTLPALGDEMSTEGEIISLIDPGTIIVAGDILMEIETDKVVIEIPSPDSGIIETLDVKVGDRVSGGKVYGSIAIELKNTELNGIDSSANDLSSNDLSNDENKHDTTMSNRHQQASTTDQLQTSAHQQQEGATSTPSDNPAGITSLETLTLPTLGDDGAEGTVLSIKNIGESFNKDDILLEIETDKTVIEVPAPCAGIITELLISKAQTVRSGMPYCKVTTEHQPAAAVKDVVSNNIATTTERKTVEITDHPNDHTTDADNQTVCAAAGPAARRMARTLGVDIAQVEGTGSRQRVTKDDVVLHAKHLIQQRSPATSNTSLRQNTKPLPDISEFGPVHKIPQSGIAKATSRNMQFAWSEIPHAWVQEEIDITALETLRKHVKQSTKGDTPLTVTAILCKVVALGLQRFPAFNAVLDTTTDDIIFRDYINIGVAVDTPRGLVVPSLRSVNNKTSLEIGQELKAISEKAVASKLTANDFKGSGFTISNLGGIGVSGMFPVVNWPEVAILGVASSRQRCELHDGQVENRLIMPLTLGFDHRVINGADAARFLGFIRDCIQQPGLLLITL